MVSFIKKGVWVGVFELPSVIQHFWILATEK